MAWSFERMAGRLVDHVAERLAERRREKLTRASDIARAQAEKGTLLDGDLVYAARMRCICGAGMAYPKGIGPHGFWDCSDILTGRASPAGNPSSRLHEARLPFAFYELQSELQPSALRATTRGSKPKKKE